MASRIRGFAVNALTSFNMPSEVVENGLPAHTLLFERMF
jgi:hypothetical protein